MSCSRYSAPPQRGPRTRGTSPPPLPPPARRLVPPSISPIARLCRQALRTFCARRRGEERRSDPTGSFYRTVAPPLTECSAGRSQRASQLGALWQPSLRVSVSFLCIRMRTESQPLGQITTSSTNQRTGPQHTRLTTHCSQRPRAVSRLGPLEPLVQALKPDSICVAKPILGRRGARIDFANQRLRSRAQSADRPIGPILRPVVLN
jgi:hypothetical protein